MLTAWVEAPVQDWLSGSLAVLAGWKRRQQRLCTESGCEVLPSIANFFCMRRPAGLPLRPDLEWLRAQGIKLRDCASFGLPHHVRLGVLPPQSQDALVAAWKS
jgi:histidinol-phosphate aminotransferase